LNNLRSDSKNGHNHNGGAEVVVIVGEPESKGQDLEDVEGIENFHEQELYDRLNLHVDLIVPVN